jgi:hypothetical protein
MEYLCKCFIRNTPVSNDHEYLIWKLSQLVGLSGAKISAETSVLLTILFSDHLRLRQSARMTCFAA